MGVRRARAGRAPQSAEPGGGRARGAALDLRTAQFGNASGDNDEWFTNRRTITRLRRHDTGLRVDLDAHRA